MKTTDDVHFVCFLKSLLVRGVKENCVNDILSKPENILIFKEAFTSKEANANRNYEHYEQLGDVSINKFIVWYYSKRFPITKCAEGIKLVARLRIKYASKQSLSEIADRLRFWPWIICSDLERTRQKKAKLEDVFEAFVGAAEEILDTVKFGLGYAGVFKMLSTIFDEIDVDLRYEILFDAKTRLKELFDHHPRLAIGTMNKPIINVLPWSSSGGGRPQQQQPVGGSFKMTHVNLYRRLGERDYLIGSGSAPLQADAEQLASEQALSYLNGQGFTKELTEIFKKIQGLKK
jgi:dsRNA-specific ribonuclease